MTEFMTKAVGKAQEAEYIHEVWVISANEALVSKIQKVLQPLTRRIQAIAPALAGDGLGEKLRSGDPALIVLDIGADVDQGVGLLREIKQTRAQVPTVVMTEQFSREFGVKILSEGISYYFPHDFAKTELVRLTRSIFKKCEKEHSV